MTRGSEALERGLRHLLLGDARAAVEPLEEACRRLPGEPAALHDLAVAQRLTGQVRAPGALVARSAATSAAAVLVTAAEKGSVSAMVWFLDWASGEP